MTQPTPAGTPRLGPIDHARTASAERQQRHDGGPATAEQLLNLADRTPHGLTPDETARLRDGVAHHCARAEKAERAVDHLTDRYRGAEAELQQWRDTYGEHALRRTLARLHGAIGQDPNACIDMDKAGACILAALDEHQEQPSAPPVHVGNQANAEDCPACDTRELPYPWICPGPADA